MTSRSSSARTSPWPVNTQPSLTSVNTDIDAYGRSAVDILLASIAGHDVPPLTVLPHTLLEEVHDLLRLPVAVAQAGGLVSRGAARLAREVAACIPLEDWPHGPGEPGHGGRTRGSGAALTRSDVSTFPRLFQEGIKPSRCAGMPMRAKVAGRDDLVCERSSETE
jgi:hypothetical protein